MREKERKKMSDYISQEVLTEILKRLPVKSLVKCKCVCKSWYSLISTPMFISLHISHSIESKKVYPLVRLKSPTDYKERFFVCHGTEHQELDLPFKHQDFLAPDISMSDHFEIVGSCNGLVCVFDLFYRRLYIWNPVLGQCINILSGEPTFAAGFGFDSKRNDYKVVRVVYGYEQMGSRLKLIPAVVHIYDLSSNSWRSTVYVKKPRYVGYRVGPSAYLNGVVHWPAQIPCGKNRPVEFTIASFDLGGETFGELKLPDAVADMNVNILSLLVCGGLLALIQYQYVVWRFDGYVWDPYCCIWVMKEYGISQSWSKFHVLNLQNHGGLLSVLSFWGNDEILLEKLNGELISYDSKTQRITSLRVLGASGRYKVHTYTESLVSLSGLNGNLEEEKLLLSSEESSALVEGEN